MEAYLVENDGVLGLDQDVLSSVEIIDTELSVKQGRTSLNSDGRIDILAAYSQEYLGIIELKLGQLEESHLHQLEDYLMHRDEVLKMYPDALPKEIAASPKWIGVLVGTSVNADLARKISSGYQAQDSIPIAALAIQRYISSDNQVFVITDTFFGGLSAARDTGKYVFDGLEYGKGRLVLEVVRKHVNTNPSLGFQGLLAAFPRECQGGRYGVFDQEQVAQETYAQTGRYRYFNKAPQDIVKLSDCKVAVCSQWGIGNIDRFIKRAKELGYQISRSNH